MTNEHEKQLRPILAYFQQRMREVDSDREERAIEALYDLIADIEASTNNCPNSCCYR